MSAEEQKLNADEQLARIKKQRHDAYRKWYLSPKGKEYHAKRRAKLKIERMEKAESK